MDYTMTEYPEDRGAVPISLVVVGFDFSKIDVRIEFRYPIEREASKVIIYLTLDITCILSWEIQEALTIMLFNLLELRKIRRGEV